MKPRRSGMTSQKAPRTGLRPKQRGANRAWQRYVARAARSGLLLLFPAYYLRRSLAGHTLFVDGPKRYSLIKQVATMFKKCGDRIRFRVVDVEDVSVQPSHAKDFTDLLVCT